MNKIDSKPTDALPAPRDPKTLARDLRAFFETKVFPKPAKKKARKS